MSCQQKAHRKVGFLLGQVIAGSGIHHDESEAITSKGTRLSAWAQARAAYEEVSDKALEKFDPEMPCQAMPAV
jgi:hypothetical protein